MFRKVIAANAFGIFSFIHQKFGAYPHIFDKDIETVSQENIEKN